MGKLSATDFVEGVRVGIGNVPADEISDAQILQLVNLVYRRLCNRYDHPEIDDDMTLTTTAGVASVTCTTPIADILSFTSVLNVTNSQVMQFFSRDQYDWYDRGQGALGSPYRYHVHPSATPGYHDLLFWPVPDAAYVIRVAYQKNPDALVQVPAPAKTVISSTWDDVILASGIAECAALVGDLQRAQYWEGKASMLEKMAYPSTIMASEVPYRITDRRR